MAIPYKITQSTKSRAWFATVRAVENGTSLSDLPPVETIRKQLMDLNGGRYLVFQAEEGEEKDARTGVGHIHYQLYVYFEVAKSLRQVRGMLPRCHWDVRRGEHDEAREYCTKAKTRIAGPFEFGQPPVQGKRNDLIEIKKLLDRNVPMVSLILSRDTGVGPDVFEDLTETGMFCVCTG